MNNRKYTYKNSIPKSLKKKKRKNLSQSPYKTQKKKSIHKRQTHHISRLLSYVKLPSVLLIASLMTIILVIPTLIVVPFNQKESTHANKESTESEEEVTIEQDDDSALSVAVMRTQSEEVENIPLETYVARVVASEMPAEFELEALKAQALAARTYIVNYLLHNESPEDPNVTDGTEHQVYKNDEELRRQWGSDYQWKMEKLTEAVEATKGKILTYNNAPITPAYFSTSNGYTENSEDYWENEIPYLRSVESKWDEKSPEYLDQQILTIPEVAQALDIDLPESTYISMDVTRTNSQRVKELTIGDHTFSGREVREKLQLQSSDFSIEQKNNHLIFKTKGYGHGVGMSQYGANGMAKEGKNYEDIVKYYYKDIEVNSLNQVAPTLVSN
ncbi:MAG TPA: stage II sporulation protein D [Virgibacillus sp.]|nr:stage II sporulation protein D [Virgibacillus sp.]